MKNSKAIRSLISFACICYLAVMLYLLFFQRMGRTSSLTYWEQLETSVNFVPFHTIHLFWDNLSSERDYIVRRAVVNLAGNIAMFVPLGVFLPYYWVKQRKFRWFLTTVILTIFCVEILQLFTLLGACDVDDLLFNVGGACLGFLTYSVFRHILIKRGMIKE